MPPKKGCSPRIRSRLSAATGHSPFCWLLVTLADCACFLCDVDGNRTPGDAAPATHAARCAKLVDPGGQLVGHPLTIAGPCQGSHGTAVDVREIHGETRVQLAPAFGVLARQVCDIFHGRAEAGGTDHRAVAAGQAALGDVVPARVLIVAVEQLFDALRVYGAAHLAGSLGDDAYGLRLFLTAGRLGGDLLQDFAAQPGADLRDEV